MKVLVGQLILDQRPELADGLRSVGSLESFDPWMMTSEVVATIARFRPDVVLVHRLMLDMSFLLRDYLRQGSCPDARVVIGSHPVTNVDKIETAHAGFADVVDLGADSESLCRRLLAVADGLSALDNDPLWSAVSRPPRVDDLQLVPRDSTDEEILRLIAIGLSDQEIAESVDMSSQTVRNRVSHMLIRFGLSNRTQMAWVFTHQNLLKRISLGIERRPRPS